MVLYNGADSLHSYRQGNNGLYFGRISNFHFLYMIWKILIVKKIRKIHSKSRYLAC